MTAEVLAPDKVAEKEKRAAALSSVVAAILLTSFKLAVGLITNSLGIISEAAHSGLDLVAALVTFFAVRIADRPPDREHQFGHGKVENFSALVETLLLLGTCAWIVYEAVSRLRHPVEIEVSAWAFIVMAVSIVVDVSRSRMLYKAARKHNSQALEADALHFKTDIYSSSVVIVGLGLVRLADLLPEAYRVWFLRADAMAALVVAGIVVFISLELGKRTIDNLLDAAPLETVGQIEAAIRAVPRVESCSRLRMRTAGPTLFGKVTVYVDPDLPTGDAHQVADQVEQAVVAVCPRCDLTIHIEPAAEAETQVDKQVRTLAERSGLQLGELHTYRLERGHHVNMDVLPPAGMSIEEAHRRAEELEKAVQSALGEGTVATASVRRSRDK